MIISILPLFLFSSCDTKEVRTEKEAIAIALENFYKGKEVNNQEDTTEWEAVLKDGIWTVSPKMEEGELGGGSTAEIDAKSGKIIKIYFTE